MGHVQRDNSVGTCFCARGCPYPTHPSRNYAIQHRIGSPPPIACFLKAHLYTSQVASIADCLWQPDVRHCEVGSSSNLQKFLTFFPVTDESYDMQFKYFPAVGLPTIWRLTFGFNRSEWPGAAYLLADCGRSFTLPDVMGNFRSMQCTPVPAWLCNQQEFRDWADENSLFPDL